MKDPPEKFNLFFQGFSILIAIIVTYYQLYQIDKEQTTQAMFLFGIIIGIFLIGLILSFTYSKYKEMRGELKENRIKMEDIQKELRYEKGLVYGVSAGQQTLSDSGAWVMRTSTSKNNVNEVLGIITTELKKVCEQGLSAEQVKFAQDKIEKSPLYHFYPGISAFSIATSGCNLSCQFCQNFVRFVCK